VEYSLSCLPVSSNKIAETSILGVKYASNCPVFLVNMSAMKLPAMPEEGCEGSRAVWGDGGCCGIMASSIRVQQ
jgi:hypothetical protein